MWTAERFGDPERVVLPFPTIAAERPLDDLEDDESFWREMMEKSPSEFFIDYVIWPLLGAAIAALLILVIAGSLWLSVKLGFDLKAMLT